MNTQVPNHPDSAGRFEQGLVSSRTSHFEQRLVVSREDGCRNELLVYPESALSKSSMWWN